MISTSSRACRLGILLLLIGSIASGEVVITTVTDENNGSLDPGLGSGTSLREAVLHAPDGSVIGFSPALDGQTLVLVLGQISVSKNLSINASPLAAGVTVSGNHASRVLNVAVSKTVSLTALGLIDGNASGDGGAILNAGNLMLDRCELTSNEASDGGGAIENSGTLTLTACTLADNTAEVGGGAIEHASGTLTATNCTFTGNSAEFGGAIDGDGSSTIRLYSCTVSGNHATNDGGGIEETTGTLLLENSIIAGNTAADQGPDLKASSINTQSGVNLLSSTGGLGGTFGGIVANPDLAALADNGGRTRTMLPPGNSPAIDAGGSTMLIVDQRGLPRVAGAATDIGSVEVQQGSPPPLPIKVLLLQAFGDASLTASPFDIGQPANVFDGNPASLLRSAAVNPAFVQVAFDSSRTTTGFRTLFSSLGSYRWKVEAADTPADMASKSRSWAEIVPWQASAGDDVFRSHTLPQAVTAKLYKLVAERLTGDDYVHINEWELLGPPPVEDEDLSVAWIQRLPVIDYVWDSPQPDVDGWPVAGSTVTWRARVKNWSPAARADVGYRWLIDGAVVASGTVDLSPQAYTNVDLPWTWTFDRHDLVFELDPEGLVAESSEANNTLRTWTDAISVGFWIEQTFYDYMHACQQELGIGSNGFEDWAQRQVRLWNDQFATAVHPVDVPQGVLDRVRIDKVTLVPDHTLPLNGGPPSNRPDQNDRSVDLMWGFHSWTTGGVLGYMEDGLFTSEEARTTVSETNPFHHDWVLFHEIAHARYLADVYSFGVQSGLNSVGTDTGSEVAITLNGQPVPGTAYMPRFPTRHVFWPSENEPANPFFGLMHQSNEYVKVDRYSAMALNRIAGHRATLGNYNGPLNGAIFLEDLPEQNTVQISDGHGNLLGGAAVSLYRGLRGSSGIYPKVYDDVADATFVTNPQGCIEIGNDPFGSPFQDIGVEVAILRVDAGGKSGFGFLPVGLFNMEHWRGHAAQGRHELQVAMIGTVPEIAGVMAWTEGPWRLLRIVLGGTVPPFSVMVDGIPAHFQTGAWWITMPNGSNPDSQIVASWAGGPTLTRTVPLSEPAIVPQLHPQKITDGLRVGWWSRAGYRYTLEHSEDLFDWSPAEPGTIHFGTGGWMEADDLLPSVSGRAFSRIQAERLTD